MDFSEISIPNPLGDLLESCVECIPSCCDLDSFYVDEINVRKWVRVTDVNQLSLALEQLVSIIQEVQRTNQPIQCEPLGFRGTYLANPQSLLDCFKDWEAVIKDVIANPED